MGGSSGFPSVFAFLRSTPDGLAAVNTQKISRRLTDEKGSENVSMFPKIRSAGSPAASELLYLLTIFPSNLTLLPSALRMT